ncbi:MAG TPA: polyketide cyclase / dehydrase and lipid transport [Pseudonocardiaceae bacterium]
MGLVHMTSVDVSDETWFAVPARVLAAVFAPPRSWPRIWPDLQLEVFADRGEQGMRWTVTGALVGSMEVWLEALGPGPVSAAGSGAGSGTVLHYYLRADLAGPDGAARPVTPRRAGAEAAWRHRAAKRFALTLKRRLEAGRAPGEPPRHG